MSSLSGTTGTVAVVAAAVAILALVACAALAVSLRRLRAAQRVVLGDRGQGDLVAHAAELDEAFRALHGYVEEVASRLDERMAETERRLHLTFVHRGLVRYDAYNEMSGRQSVSIALLDDSESGVVLTSIHHREQARLYAKQVMNGRGQLELSPEEAEAVRLALAGEVQEVD